MGNDDDDHHHFLKNRIGCDTNGGTLATTFFCLISVGYHLELHATITFNQGYHSFTQIKWVVNMHIKKNDIT